MTFYSTILCWDEQEHRTIWGSLDLQTVDKPKPQKELILFCGWRRDLRDIILMLEPLVQPNTELHIMCNMGREERDTLLAEGGLDVSQLSNLQIRHLVGESRAVCCPKIPWIRDFRMIFLVLTSGGLLQLVASMWRYNCTQTTQIPCVVVGELVVLLPCCVC